jgi:hypothetical protein
VLDSECRATRDFEALAEEVGALAAPTARSVPGRERMGRVSAACPGSPGPRPVDVGRLVRGESRTWTV